MCSKCGAHSPKNIHVEKLNVMSLSRNHDPVSQNNPQTLLWAVLCRNYFLNLLELLSYLHKTWFLEKRHYCWVFQFYFWGCERRQKSLQLISPELYTLKLSWLIKSITCKRKNTSFWFGVKVTNRLTHKEANKSLKYGTRTPFLQISI